MTRLSMPNRRIRGRMYGGVGGEVSNGLPYPIFSDLGQNGLGFGGPLIGLWIGIMVLQIVHDRCLQVCDAAEDTPADALFRDVPEEALDQIDPGG